MLTSSTQTLPAANRPAAPTPAADSRKLNVGFLLPGCTSGQIFASTSNAIRVQLLHSTSSVS